MPPALAIDLFQAYTQNRMPSNGGYLVLAQTSAAVYGTRYDFLTLSSIKSAHSRSDGLELRASGARLSLTVEESPSILSGASDRTELTLLIPRPDDGGFAFIFPASAGALPTLAAFLEKTLIAESNLPPDEAERATAAVTERLRQLTERKL